MSTPDVQTLIERARGGDRDAVRQLVPLVYDELHALARIQRRRWRGPMTLNTTALLNEAYVKLAGTGPDPQWRDRAHFVAIAATAMRQILIDHVRRRGAKKRGGDLHPVTFENVESLLSSGATGADTSEETLILLDDCLTRLGAEDERLLRIVECRFFGGLTIEETADALEVSPATVKRGWVAAQAWLYRAMQGGSGA